MRRLEFNIFSPLQIRDVQVTSCLRATLALSYASLLRQIGRKKEKNCVHGLGTKIQLLQTCSS